MRAALGAGRLAGVILFRRNIVDVAQVRRGTEPDRLEALDVSFHERVRSGYLAQAAAAHGRWVVIDAAQEVAAVSADVDRALGLA